jgi:NAD(P)-dependent dehydrogenase (short-subunit alcohol dehydrogenase family)
MLKGLVVVVTNVVHFVGAATADALAAQGARVVCHDKTFADPAAAADFKAAHPSVIVTNEIDPDAALAHVEATIGPLDVLVSNDFFPAIRAPIDEANVADLRSSLEALFITPFRFAAAAARIMKPRRRGKIVFVTSAAPLEGLANYTMYASGRGATNALVISLARELAAFNIQVNAVAPNYVASPSYFPPELIANPDALKRMTDKVPLRRLGTPEEVAAAIVFLASSGSDFITGHVMPVAGGWA